jgi:citrate lyase subunit beta/citryl-CoA lyase
MREGAQIVQIDAARPRRSALYLPASNPRAIEKARSLPCDVVLLDLEDAVAPDAQAKAEARALAVEAARAGGFGARELVIRVNGLDTPWGAEDMAAVAQARPDAMLIPKVSAIADFVPYAAVGVPLWAMIETCAAVFALEALAKAAAGARVEAWVMGTNDLIKEMRCRPGPDRAPLQPALAMSVMAARAHGIAILDGVWNDIADIEGLERECAQGAAFGFDGKTVIHPSHLAAANRAFSPDPEAVAWARRVAAAFDLPESAGRGVIKVEGRMVERLHLAQAQRLIAVAEAVAAHED